MGTELQKRNFLLRAFSFAANKATSMTQNAAQKGLKTAWHATFASGVLCTVFGTFSGTFRHFNTEATPGRHPLIRWVQYSGEDTVKIGSWTLSTAKQAAFYVGDALWEAGTEAFSPENE